MRNLPAYSVKISFSNGPYRMLPQENPLNMFQKQECSFFLKFHNTRLPGSLNNLFVSNMVWCPIYEKIQQILEKKKKKSFGFAFSFDNQFLIVKKYLILPRQQSVDHSKW